MPSDDTSIPVKAQARAASVERWGWAGLAIVALGAGVGLGYAAAAAGGCECSATATSGAASQTCLGANNRSTSSAMLDILTGEISIDLSTDGVSDIEDYCRVLIEFAKMGEGDKNTELFGTSDPLSAGANSSDPRVQALMSRVGGPGGKGHGAGKGGGRRLSEASSLAYTVTLGGEAATQLGSDLYGEAAADSFGTSVALNSDGSIVAAGAELNDAGGSAAGHVRIFEYTYSPSSGGSDWVQMGSDIDGAMADERFGRTMSMSSDGWTLAIGGERSDAAGVNKGGVCRVYQWDGSAAWGQLGGDLLSETKLDYFGAAVALSGDGLVVAIGYPGYGSKLGAVKVYDWTGTSWAQREMHTTYYYTLVGYDDGDRFGSALALNSDGSILAIGSPMADGAATGSNGGSVDVWEWDGSAYSLLGSSIEPTGASRTTNNNAYCGQAVALSAAGLTLAIGCPRADLSDSGYALQGEVNIFEYSSTSADWVSAGTVTPEAGSDPDSMRFGEAVSLSDSGDVLAVGAWSHDASSYDYGGSRSNAGRVKVYQRDSSSSSSWTVDPLLTLTGGAASDRLGGEGMSALASAGAVALSGDGTTVAAGAQGSDASAANAGAVMIYLTGFTVPPPPSPPASAVSPPYTYSYYYGEENCAYLTEGYRRAQPMPPLETPALLRGGPAPRPKSKVPSSTRPCFACSSRERPARPPALCRYPDAYNTGGSAWRSSYGACASYCDADGALQ